jgi:hypothetical protein
MIYLFFASHSFLALLIFEGSNANKLAGGAAFAIYLGSREGQRMETGESF